MKKLTRKEIDKILENHQHWLKKDCENWEKMKAKFCGVDLCGVDLSHANLRGADFFESDLSQADFYRTDLGGASFICAKLNETTFYNANLRGAYFNEANLYKTKFYESNLKGAVLDGANCYQINFYGTKNIPYIPMVCPENGSFIGWKKVKEYIIKLEIPTEAKRSSATTRKCRCEFAKVLGIYELNGKKANIEEITNDSLVYRPCVYKVGEMVYPDKFDDDRWVECSNGIHFFVNRQEAINY